MKNKNQISFWGACLLFAVVPASANVVFNFNAVPPESLITAQWSAAEVGWFFTPGSTLFNVTEIKTAFASTAGWNQNPVNGLVTEEIFKSFVPGTGGTLIASNSFAPISNTYTGGFFAGPITLLAGTQYFIGFRNVAGLGSNIVNYPGVAAVPLQQFFSGVNDGLYSTSTPSEANSAPTLIFYDNLITPEPASGLLALVGVAGLFLGRRTLHRLKS